MLSKAKKIFAIQILICLMMVASPAFAYDLNEKMSIEGALTGVFQYGAFDVEGMDDTNKGVAAFDLGVNFHPSEKDEFQVTLSYAAGNALNGISPFSLAPYADDLEDDLQNINGSNRGYLLEAWYKHKLTVSENASLGLTGGIIDGTAYIDDNNFANDETGQFMNDIFVNNTLANLPSYELGGAAEFEISKISVRGIVMNTRNESNENSNYYALQIGYTLDIPMGEGNYRVYGFTTNKRFQNWDGTDEEKLSGFGASIDQELSEIIGVFVRAGWQDDDAVVDHTALYSGGVNIKGKLWGREDDNAGVGYAYLKGADDGDIDNTTAVEAYAKVKTSEMTDVTFDVQYIKDKMENTDDNEGVIYGIRLNACF
ncbi:MAG: carbohydrate porin [Nitrospirota bacterium]